MRILSGLILLAMLLAGCGGGDGEATATQAPATPTRQVAPVSTAVATSTVAAPAGTATGILPVATDIPTVAVEPTGAAIPTAEAVATVAATAVAEGTAMPEPTETATREGYRLFRSEEGEYTLEVPADWEERPIGVWTLFRDPNGEAYAQVTYVDEVVPRGQRDEFFEAVARGFREEAGTAEVTFRRAGMQDGMHVSEFSMTLQDGPTVRGKMYVRFQSQGVYALILGGRAGQLRKHEATHEEILESWNTP